MMTRASSDRRALPYGLVSGAAILAVLLTVAAFIFRDNAYEFTLDPKQPFQTAARGAIPDYTRPEAWAALGTDSSPERSSKADLFFVHGTTFAGDNRWNASINDPATGHVAQTVLPEEAGPFGETVRLYAPYYRQATLYTFRTRSEDSRRARSLAYQDIRRAFAVFLQKHNDGRPFVLAGVGQGGLHVTGLLQDDVANNTAADRLLAAYILAHPVPLDLFDGPLKAFRPCTKEMETGCVLSWTAYPKGIRAHMVTDRAMVWDDQRLTAVAGRPILCAVPQDLIGRSATIECAEGILRVGGRAALKPSPSPYPRRPFHHLSATLLGEAVGMDVSRRLNGFQAGLTSVP